MVTQASVLRSKHTRGAALLGALLELALGLSFALAGPVWAGSGEGSGGSYVVSGKADPEIILTLGTSSVNLSGVDPACASVAGTSAYAGSTGNEGCAYVWTVSVQVQSNKAWKGTLAGVDNGLPTSQVTVANGNYHASTSALSSYASCTGATTVPGAADPNDEWTWENSRKKGNIIGTHYHCVMVDWDDDDGTIDSTISYSVSQ